jgi:hypothetical protein
VLEEKVAMLILVQIVLVDWCWSRELGIIQAGGKARSSLNMDWIEALEREVLAELPRI